MKIFGIALNGITYNKALEEALYKKTEPALFTKAESALTKGGKPFFIPDHLGHVSQEACAVVRINRFGKSVPLRFAHRYWDALTLGVDFTATDLLNHLRTQGMPWDLAKSLDGSLPIGEWVMKEQLDKKAILRLTREGTTLQEERLDAILPVIDGFVSYISQFFTLKTGDIMLIDLNTPTEAIINTHLCGYIGEQQVLSMNVK